MSLTPSELAALEIGTDHPEALLRNAADLDRVLTGVSPVVNRRGDTLQTLGEGQLGGKFSSPDFHPTTAPQNAAVNISGAFGGGLRMTDGAKSLMVWGDTSGDNWYFGEQEGATFRLKFSWTTAGTTLSASDGASLASLSGGTVTWNNAAGTSAAGAKQSITAGASAWRTNCQWELVWSGSEDSVAATNLACGDINGEYLVVTSAGDNLRVSKLAGVQTNGPTTLDAGYSPLYLYSARTSNSGTFLASRLTLSDGTTAARTITAIYRLT